MRVALTAVVVSPLMPVAPAVDELTDTYHIPVYRYVVVSSVVRVVELVLSDMARLDEPPFPANIICPRNDDVEAP